MPDEIELGRGAAPAESQFSGWRVVASAWLVAILLLVLFAGVQAVASLHTSSPHRAGLAGAVIPRHDPSCPGADAATLPSSQSCLSEREALDRAETEAYSAW